MNRIQPETRNIKDIQYWKRINKNGTIEYYSKDEFNSDFTRKIDINNEVKNLIDEIQDLLNSK
jgi:hypothetical protein